MEDEIKVVAWKFQSKENLEKHRAYQREYQRQYQKNYVRVRGYQPRPDKKNYYLNKVKPEAPYRIWAKRLLKIKL